METHRILRPLAAVACLFLSAAAAQAQVPQEVRSRIVEAHDSAWYESQAEAWQRVVQTTGARDERAWRNYFEAARWAGRSAAFMDSLVARMGRSVPGSLTWHLCAYRNDPSPDSPHGAQIAARAAQSDLRGEDANVALSYLLARGELCGGASPCPTADSLLRRQWREGFYPEELLRFSYNQLQGMADGAIYFANGDTDVFCKLLLQRAAGVHRDKLVVCTSFLFFPAYREALFRALQIEPIPGRGRKPTAEDQVAYPGEVAAYVAEKTGRPVYISPWNRSYTRTIETKLYNEGLAFRYSPVPYDHIAAAKQAVESRYRLDYLLEPAYRPQVSWSGSAGVQANYAVLLGHLVRSYREAGDEGRATRLYERLRAAVERSSVGEGQKREYMDYLDRNR